MIVAQRELENLRTDAVNQRKHARRVGIADVAQERRCQRLVGIYQYVYGQPAFQVFIDFLAHDGNSLDVLLHFGQHGDDHIQLIVSRCSHHAVGLVHPQLRHQRLVHAVAVDDLDVRKFLRKPLAFSQVLFHQNRVHLRDIGAQTVRQIGAQLAAAHDDDPRQPFLMPHIEQLLNVLHPFVQCHHKAQVTFSSRPVA